MTDDPRRTFRPPGAPGPSTSGPELTFAQIGRLAGPRGRLEAGAIVGGVYSIIKIIGQGGMGEVYLAEHQTLKKLCALKLIPPEEVTANSWMRFQQEARSVGSLQHPNLVQVTDLGIHKDYLPFYAMEYVDGQSLADLLIKQKQIPLALAMEIFAQVCDGVDYAHRAGIIHRDLKPANIMVVPSTAQVQGQIQGQEHGQVNAPISYRVKILDFGLAKLVTHDRHTQSLTSIGDIFGSPYYMSPEQCAGENVDARSDIYSIGCTLFECLTGRPPFDGNISTAVIFAQQESNPPSLRAACESAAEFPDSIELVMAKLLRKNPAERYQNCLELKDDLRRVAQGKTVMSTKHIARPVVIRRDVAANDVVLRPDIISGDGSKIPLILLVGGVTAILLTAVGGFIYLGNELRHPAPKAVLMIPKGELTPERIILPEMKEATVADELGKVPDRSVMAKSGLDKGFYSTRQRIHGRDVIVFDFPTDTRIGTISNQLKQSGSAYGHVLYPASDAISFQAWPQAIYYPQYLKRFRATDITTLVIDNPTDINHELAVLSGAPYWSNIKSVQFLSVGNNGIELDQSGWKSLDKMPKVKMFRAASSFLPSKKLCAVSWFAMLESLDMKGLPDMHGILRFLKNSKYLNTLVVAQCNLTDDDLHCIALMPALKSVDIRNSISSAKKLAYLADAPSLESLTVDASLIMEPEFVIYLRRFHHLKSMDTHNTKPEHRARLKVLAKQIPGLRLRYTVDGINGLREDL